MKRKQINFTLTEKSKTYFIFCVTFCVTFFALCDVTHAKPVIKLNPGQCLDLGLELICAPGSDETLEPAGETFEYDEQGTTYCVCKYAIHTGNPAKGWWLQQITDDSSKMLKNYGSKEADCLKSVQSHPACNVGSKKIRYKNYRGY